MPKGLVFFLGIVTGFILTILALFFIGNSKPPAPDDGEEIQSETVDNGITLSEQPTEFTASDRFEVFQVMEKGALAKCADPRLEMPFFSGPDVYILSDGQNMFYDGQRLTVPDGKKAVMIGTYSYEYFSGKKVVPLIRFE